MIDGERGDVSRREQIDRDALGWVIKLERPDAADLRKEFDEWRRQSPDHQRAYDWASGHHDTARTLKLSRRHGVNRPGSKPRQRHVLIAGLAAVAVLTIALATQVITRTTLTSTPEIALASEPIVSARGEIRQFRLIDGSRVTLDSESRATIAMTRTERRLKLTGGKARVAVARDTRPFFIAAGAGEVRADEAVIDIALENDDHVEVAIVSGTADLGPAIRQAAYERVVVPLSAGRTLAYPAAVFRPMPAADKAIERREWTSGWLEYRDTPLSTLFAEANRYAAVPIVIDDPALAARRVSGRFRIVDTTTFASRIAKLFDLKLARRSDGLHLTTK